MLCEGYCCFLVEKALTTTLSLLPQNASPGLISYSYTSSHDVCHNCHISLSQAVCFVLPILFFIMQTRGQNNHYNSRACRSSLCATCTATRDTLHEYVVRSALTNQNADRGLGGAQVQRSQSVSKAVCDSLLYMLLTPLADFRTSPAKQVRGTERVETG